METSAPKNIQLRNKINERFWNNIENKASASFPSTPDILVVLRDRLLFFSFTLVLFRRTTF